jgi:hypothetical protein
MSSNLDLINDALSLIGVLPEGLSASPEQSALALRELNNIAEEWADDNIIVNWSSQSALADTSSLMGLERSAMLYALAIKLCPHFGREPPQSVIALSISSGSKLQRIQLVQSLAPVTLSLPAAEGAYGTENILTGE